MEDGRRVDLVAEVLDQQLLDFIGRPMGNGAAWCWSSGRASRRA